MGCRSIMRLPARRLFSSLDRSHSTRIVSLWWVLSVFGAGNSNAAEATNLRPYAPLERALGPVTTHQYEVNASAGEFFRIALEPSVVVPVLSASSPVARNRVVVQD